SVGGKRNYLFADGHVKFLDATELRKGHTGFTDPNATIGGLGGVDYPR
ncbi:MAG TPA: hypothetical protein DCZ72_09455, partial [Armatimonadetes bacterium]|nr:hypothetical protein [Armatimonadota bacterium]